MASEDRNIGKARILIVDDMEMNRVILEEIIKDIGGDPVSAESGEQALELVKEQCPDLVLTDISMPGMDGYELCKILKRKKRQEMFLLYSFRHMMSLRLSWRVY
ncbi:MAG: response regulator, partial [Lachnospiraceae bacterium]|nr:response regulator [Lachnospiraceae bacterium]